MASAGFEEMGDKEVVISSRELLCRGENGGARDEDLRPWG